MQFQYSDKFAPVDDHYKLWIPEQPNCIPLSGPSIHLVIVSKSSSCFACIVISKIDSIVVDLCCFYFIDNITWIEQCKLKKTMNLAPSIPMTIEEEEEEDDETS